MAEPAALRSYLYAPGSSQRMLAKVLDAGADAVVLDLEDAVAAGEKAGARAQVGEFVARHCSGVSEIHVRINRASSGFDLDDVRAVLAPGLDALRLPKCADADEIRRLDAEVTDLERVGGMAPGHVALYPTVETAAAVLAAERLATASPRVARLAFGSVDFLADIEARDGSGDATLYARSHLVIAARAAGIGAPIDGVHTAVEDLSGLRRAARHARDLGFFGKSVIHPTHVPIVHEVFTPTDDEIARARALLHAYDQASEEGQGGTVVGGEFVDAAAVSRARRLLELADASAGNRRSVQR